MIIARGIRSLLVLSGCRMLCPVKMQDIESLAFTGSYLQLRLVEIFLSQLLDPNDDIIS